MTGQTFAIIGSLFAGMALQTFWISRGLDRIEKRLDRIEDAARDHGERITRLEAKT